LQWLQDPSEINGVKLNNVRREASKHFRNKNREFLKHKITELATSRKNKNIRDIHRGINEFKRGYQTSSGETDVLNYCILSLMMVLRGSKHVAINIFVLK
jgi:Fe-S cluster assembly ATPase SufC